MIDIEGTASCCLVYKYSRFGHCVPGEYERIYVLQALGIYFGQNINWSLYRGIYKMTLL